MTGIPYKVRPEIVESKEIQQSIFEQFENLVRDYNNYQQ